MVKKCKTGTIQAVCLSFAYVTLLFLRLQQFPTELLCTILSFPSPLRVPWLLHGSSHTERLLLLGSQYSSLCSCIVIYIILMTFLWDGYNLVINSEIRKLGAGRILSAWGHIANSGRGNLLCYLSLINDAPVIQESCPSSVFSSVSEMCFQWHYFRPIYILIDFLLDILLCSP